MHFTQKLYQNQVISTDELMEVSTNTDSPTVDKHHSKMI